MGCGASTSRGGGGGGEEYKKPISEDQLKQMCLDSCIRMEIACINYALLTPGVWDNIKITPPPAIVTLRNNIKVLQDQANSFKNTEGVVSGGGMIGGMLNSAAKVGGQIAGGGMEAACSALNGVADGLETPFQTVAKDVMEKKRASLYNTCVGYINGFQFADPLTIVRGVPPWNEESYKKVKPDTISTTMMTLAQVPLCQLLMPEVKDAIKDHLVTTGWDKAWGLYDTAYKTVTKVIKEETLAKAGIKPLELNLTEYITNEIFKELQVMMQKREGEIRADSTNKDVHKPGKPLSFAAVFSTKSLYEDDHKLWLQERVM